MACVPLLSVATKWGTYIFLTQDDLPDQISWKDEDEETNEQ